MLNAFDKRDDVKRLAPFKLLMAYANRYASSASIEVMLQHLLGKKDDFAWIAFITNHRHFKNVVSEIIAIHKNDKLDLATSVIEIKHLLIPEKAKPLTQKQFCHISSTGHKFLYGSEIN